MNSKKTIVEFGFRFASVDNILIDLHNSSHPTLPHSIVAKYEITSLSPRKECFRSSLLGRDESVLMKIQPLFMKIY